MKNVRRGNKKWNEKDWVIIGSDRKVLLQLADEEMAFITATYIGTIVDEAEEDGFAEEDCEDH